MTPPERIRLRRHSSVSIPELCRRTNALASFCPLRPLWRAALIVTLSQKSILNFGVDAMEPLLSALSLPSVCSDFGLKFGNPILGRA